MLGDNKKSKKSEVLSVILVASKSVLNEFRKQGYVIGVVSPTQERGVCKDGRWKGGFNVSCRLKFRKSERVEKV